VSVYVVVCTRWVVLVLELSILEVLECIVVVVVEVVHTEHPGAWVGRHVECVATGVLVEVGEVEVDLVVVLVDVADLVLLLARVERARVHVRVQLQHFYVEHVLYSSLGLCILLPGSLCSYMYIWILKIFILIPITFTFTEIFDAALHSIHTHTHFHVETLHFLWIVPFT